MKKLKNKRTLGRNAGQRKAMFQSMAGSLFIHKSIQTSLAKAKELRPRAEKLITLARQGDFNSIRRINKFLAKKAAMELHKNIAPAMKNRPGGYLRIIRLCNRVSDASCRAIVEIVGFEKDFQAKVKSKKDKSIKKQAPKPKKSKNKERIKAKVGDSDKKAGNKHDKTEKIKNKKSEKAK
ncbi:MAG: 50S ribosomal protein L17 [Candidatus Moranbacteria bacterium]|nr:50S ribosomal protein L17 [Candidatus Moranbacteria bacterium]